MHVNFLHIMRSIICFHQSFKHSAIFSDFDLFKRRRRNIVNVLLKYETKHSELYPWITSHVGTKHVFVPFSLCWLGTKYLNLFSWSCAQYSMWYGGHYIILSPAISELLEQYNHCKLIIIETTLLISMGTLYVNLLLLRPPYLSVWWHCM